jgi:hypothetical protein
MTKVVRFLRMRTSLLLIVYGAFLYFCTHSSRAASRALSSMIRRSHTSILSWFRSLSSLFIDRSLRLEIELKAFGAAVKRSFADVGNRRRGRGDRPEKNICM